MQRSHEFFQWWDPPFHTVLLNVQLPGKIECYVISLWCWLKFHYWCAPWVWRFANVETLHETKIQWSKLWLSKQGFTRSDLPDPIRNETSIRMHVTKQRPFLEAQNFHHKLQILLEAIIGCKTSSEKCQSHDYFQYDWRAYHRIAAFNGVIEPQQVWCKPGWDTLWHH